MSLANRLAALFALCAAVVALLAGLLFSRAIAEHFVELDQEQLNNKLQGFAAQLAPLQSAQDVAAQKALLEQELRHHPELILQVSDAEDQPLFSSQPLPIESAQQRANGTWRLQQIDYRVAQTVLSNGLRLTLLLDISHHQHFLAQMQRLIWLCVGLSALATALLGAWAARRGLKPLREMAQVAQQTSASSLAARLPVMGIPTELANLSAAFNAMLERLEQSFNRLSAFSADIAHELRTPLANLLTQTQVMLSQPRSADQYLETLHANLEDLQNLTQLVNDMLLLAKADNGLLATRKEPIQLADELNALAEYYGPLAEDAGVSIRVLAQGQLSADRLLLRRALSNLIDNALRFTPAGGELQLRATQDNIEIANQGAAIPRELQERVFDRFYRLDPARREGQTLHAGLGLAITRSIIQAHGGTIACLSDDGWTRFSIHFASH